MNLQNPVMGGAAVGGKRVFASMDTTGEARFYIAPGFPGFDNHANNRAGYTTKAGAMAASKRVVERQEAVEHRSPSRNEPSRSFPNFPRVSLPVNG